MDKRTLVSVVDDRVSVRESVPDQLGELGSAAREFNSGEAFLASQFLHQTEWLLLDIAIPGVSGLDVQRELKSRNIQILPIVFITAHRDEVVRQRALEEGVLFESSSDAVLLQALREALSTA